MKTKRKLGNNENRIKGEKDKKARRQMKGKDEKIKKKNRHDH
jgi:hypothetical protein